MDKSSLNLKKFQDYGTKISRKISINKSFGFGLPPAFYAEEGIEKYTHALLYLDESQKVVGIKFIKQEGDGEGFKLVTYGKEKGKTGASFIARSFFNKYKLDPKIYSGKYEFEKDTIGEIDDVYIFQLIEKKSEKESA